jgi:RNA polymerase sigma factor (sigma-70 family)
VAKRLLSAVNVRYVEEHAIVEALRHRDPAGLAAAYDQYAARLYDYCASLLHDRDAAGDAVHDALLAAADKAGQLRDPGRLRPWLYAIARNECLRQLKRRNKLAPLERAGEVSDESVDPDRAMAAEQAQALVRDAVVALNPREREVLELTLRHELTGSELADALGVPPNHAHALLSKARDQLERSVGALLTARAGRAECATLDGILASWDGEFTPLVRKRVGRHVDSCAVCGARRRHEVRAEALFAALPFLALPALLRRRVLESSQDLNRVAYRGRLARPFDSAGFPVPLDRSSVKRRPAAWLSAAAVLALLLGGGTVAAMMPRESPIIAEPKSRELPATPGPTETPSPTGAAVEPLPVPSASPSVSPSPSRVVVPSRSPRVVPPSPRPPSASPSPSVSPSPQLPRPTVVLNPAQACDYPQTWTGMAVGTITPSPAKLMTFVWNDPAGVPHPLTMAYSPRTGTYSVVVSGLPTGQRITYRVDAIRADGSKASSATVALTHPYCPPIP